MRGILSAYASLFGHAHPLVSLTPLSILVGIGMLWVFGRTSDQKAIQRTKKRMQAYLLELRLYGDDPALIWNTQVKLLTGNLRYMALMLKPALFLTLPMIFLLVHMDNYYGREALALGKPAIVTVQAAGRIGANTPAPTLEPPAGVAVETPAVRILDQGQFSWRIRPSEATDSELRFDWEGVSWQKTVASGPEHGYLSIRKVRAWTDTFLSAGENRLATPQVEWVEVSYPTANIEFAGLELHWLVWFFVISIAAAYLLKGYFGVVI